MTHPTLARVIDTALDRLTTRQARGYAGNVLTGWQRWSGADLKGKARKYSAGYHVQRRKARAALFAAGGCIVALRRRHGLLATGVRVCVDDYGTEVYATTGAGIVWAHDLT